MMGGRVGRDPEMFNCAAHHGLVPYTSPVVGMSCDFCSKTIEAGSMAAGCRRVSTLPRQMSLEASSARHPEPCH